MCRSSDLPTTLPDWIMTYRLFFFIFGIWSSLESCKSLPCGKNVSEGPQCLVTASVLLRTVVQPSGWQRPPGIWRNYQQPCFALPRAPEAFREFGFLLFLSSGPLGAIGSKHGPHFARKAQRDDGCCCQLLAFQLDCIFTSKYICTARKHLLMRMR